MGGASVEDSGSSAAASASARVAPSTKIGSGSGTIGAALKLNATVVDVVVVIAPCKSNGATVTC